MFTKQQQQLLAEFLINNRAPLALIEPLATPSVLCIADVDGKRALHWALEHHDDPEVIKLVISRLPPALVTVVGDVRIWEFFKDLPAENRSSNDVEIHGLLVYSYVAYKQHRFPRLIELCGTSDALEALVAAHSEDGLPLFVLCYRKSWYKVLAGIKQLAPRLQSTSSSTRTRQEPLRLNKRPSGRRLLRCWRACSIWPSWTPRRGTSWTSPTFTSAFLCTSSPSDTSIPPPSSSWSAFTPTPCSSEISTTRLPRTAPSSSTRATLSSPSCRPSPLLTSTATTSP